MLLFVLTCFDFVFQVTKQIKDFDLSLFLLVSGRLRSSA